MVDTAMLSEVRLMDRLDYVVNSLPISSITKLSTWTSQVVSNARVGLIVENISELNSLLPIVSSLLLSLSSAISNLFQAFIELYYAIVSMSMQLFEKVD
ncbi:hypothetical protein DICVIV_14467, partial [Dictyocaulus viviparus]